MNLSLKDIDESNWEECILLTTNKDNIHYLGEQFVASNAYSIVQSKFEKGWTVKAIYEESKMVGFTMYGYCYEDSFHEIARIMIDHKYQGKGYGRAALSLVIDEMKSRKDCGEIYISFGPENYIAKKMYESMGFRDTGRVIDGEILYRLNF